MSLEIQNLTLLKCDELEEFFAAAIKAGCADGEDCSEAPCTSTLPKAVGIPKSPPRKKDAKTKGSILSKMTLVEIPPSPEGPSFSAPMLEPRTIAEAAEGESLSFSAQLDKEQLSNGVIDHANQNDGAGGQNSAVFSGDEEKPDEFEPDDESVDTLTSDVVRKVVARKHFWTTVAVASFVVGASCLLFAMRMADDSRHRRSTRRFS